MNTADDLPPKLEPSLWQALDACRPGSDDVHSPEMAPLAERLLADPQLADAFAGAQRFDMLVAEALDDVPIPVGFEQRLLSALVASVQAGPGTQAALEGPAQELAESPTTASAHAPRVVPFSAARTRRRWLVGAAATAAALLVGAWLAWPRSHLTADSLPVAAQQWFLDFDPAAAAWESTTVPAGYTFPVHDLGARKPRWAAVQTGDGYHLAAYDVSLPGVTAVLFVLDGGPSGLPSQPPTTPQRSTGAESVAVWKAGGLTYALVVRGDARAYHRFLPLPPETA